MLPHARSMLLLLFGGDNVYLHLLRQVSHLSQNFRNRDFLYIFVGDSTTWAILRFCLI